MKSKKEIKNKEKTEERERKRTREREREIIANKNGGRQKCLKVRGNKKKTEGKE